MKYFLPIRGGSARQSIQRLLLLQLSIHCVQPWTNSSITEAFWQQNSLQMPEIHVCVLRICVCVLTCVYVKHRSINVCQPLRLWQESSIQSRHAQRLLAVIQASSTRGETRTSPVDSNCLTNSCYTSLLEGELTLISLDLSSQGHRVTAAAATQDILKHKTLKTTILSTFSHDTISSPYRLMTQNKNFADG